LTAVAGSSGSSLQSSRLARLARGSAAATQAAQERCELCGEPIAPEHRHLLDLRSRELMCTCRACALLFDRRAAPVHSPAGADVVAGETRWASGVGRYRLVPDRRLRIDDLQLDDLAWEELRLPVEMAFFFWSSAEGRVMAFYPSPMGPTESLLRLEAWAQIEAANPVLETMEPDVEALLVNRARGARRHWLVPIDECYSLVGLIRLHWKGLTGGKEVWTEIGRFYDALDRRSRAASGRGPGGTRSSAAAAGPAGRD
jgi:Family of unknown function (DUF5947)